MRIFITGINGFLGSSLAIFLKHNGHFVSGSTRSGKSNIQDIVTKKMELGKPYDQSLFFDQDVVIHCAHDFIYDLTESKRINIEGTKSLFKLAKSSGVKKQIFLSSYSANSEASSVYGIVKFNLECFFIEENQIIVRPGLVVGLGGLFYNNVNKILKTPIMPLINSGSDVIPLLSIDQFNRSIQEIITNREKGEYNLFLPNMITLKEFVEMINKFAKHRTLYINFPSWLIILLLRVFIALKLPTPVNLESLKGLQKNIKYPHKSHLENLINVDKNIEEILEEVISMRIKT